MNHIQIIVFYFIQLDGFKKQSNGEYHSRGNQLVLVLLKI